VPTTRSHTHMRALVLLCVTAGTRAFTAVGTTRLQHNAVRTDLRMDVLSLGAGAVVSAAAAVTGGKLVVEKVVLPSLLNGAEKKNSVAVNQYTLGRRLGQGNYGAVYQAEDAKSRVVIKELALSKDENARKFALAELFMNQKLKLCGQSSSVAQYVGHFSSLGEDEYLSIVFKDEGSLTLMDALKDRNFPRNVGSRVGINSDDEAAVIGRITGQVFGSLAAIHGWSIVHRDVKGENLILSETDRRFKLIDFGVACDLATLTNYDKDLQPFDPSYCPPEAPPVNAGGAGGLSLSAGGKFDVFSAGLLLAQMVFAPLRSDRGSRPSRRASPSMTMIWMHGERTTRALAAMRRALSSSVRKAGSCSSVASRRIRTSESPRRPPRRAVFVSSEAESGRARPCRPADA